jgi:hypothetical protein
LVQAREDGNVVYVEVVMNYYNYDRDPTWVHTPRPSADYGSKLYYFDDGCLPGGELDEDGVRWYRINCSYWFGDWIEEQDQALWRSYGGRHRAIYIIREELMTIIHLRWL